MLEHPRAPKTSSSQFADAVSVERIDEMYGLLQYLKVAVEDIRGQLAAKHKSLYTVEEVADLVGRSAFTVRRWIAAGRIQAIRVAGTGPKGRLLVPRDQLNVLVADGLAGAVPAAVVG
jgi:excisionase family DNA binding protein